MPAGELVWRVGQHLSENKVSSAMYFALIAACKGRATGDRIFAVGTGQKVAIGVVVPVEEVARVIAETILRLPGLVPILLELVPGS